MGWDEWHLEVPSLSRARGLERRIPEPPAKKKSLHDGIESGFSLKGGGCRWPARLGQTSRSNALWRRWLVAANGRGCKPVLIHSGRLCGVGSRFLTGRSRPALRAVATAFPTAPVRPRDDEPAPGCPGTLKACAALKGIPEPGSLRGLENQRPMVNI
jgi:hypothetical protein